MEEHGSTPLDFLLSHMKRNLPIGLLHSCTSSKCNDKLDNLKVEFELVLLDRADQVTNHHQHVLDLC